MPGDALFDDAVGRSDTWTVAELAAHIGRVTATAFPDDVWVVGQMRNLSRAANGHAYFNLAEPTAAGDNPRAQLSVTLLAPERRHVNDQLKRAGGAVRMADGIEVRIQGRLRWWAPRGVLQLRMHGIDPAFTLGRLQADRDRILAALAAEGLLDANGRHALPLVPLRVGLVTSIGSAAHADVLAELQGSGLGFTVRTVDARTQGADAVSSVVRGLRRLAADGVDVILLVRGGGARTDLAAFDADAVARAIALLPVPVFTGIGHEVDRSIADEVAHTAHKTPTAAAGELVDRVRRYLARVDETWAAARRAASATASVADARLDRRAARTGRAALRTLDRHQHRLDQAAHRTGRGASRVLDRAHVALGDHAADTASRARRSVVRTDRLIDGLDARVRAHDPQLALARGWTITTTADGRLVGRVADLAPGTELRTRFADGIATSTVRTTEPDPAPSDAGPSPTQEPTP